MIIKETIVVEGKDDESAIKKAVKAEIIITSGFRIKSLIFEEIKWANEKNGVIVFTDPDWAGEKIRERINKEIPGCKNAYLSQGEALKKGNIGVENASPENIKDALLKAKIRILDNVQNEFTMKDLLNSGLSGCVGSAEKRSKLGKILRIGYGNSKKFLSRLNHYQISKDDFYHALKSIQKS
ncbi:MAG: ribonuclease M5 [Desulforegulaceae bacterium]|nr:ribonuclease M5 [Desulforegulaceae bacterium]